MPLEKIIKIEGTGVYAPGDDIDTDRIIPARFMKCVTFEGLGQYLFHDVRFDKAGKSLSHPLDAPQHKGASILLSGRNFGCGSSREHAPQALQKFGIRAIVAESFAEIFAGNCTTLGLPCVIASGPEIALLATVIKNDPLLKIQIDLAASMIMYGRCQIPFQMKFGAREALLKGEWDALGQLLDGKEQVTTLAKKLGYA